MDTERLESSLLDKLPNYSNYAEKTWDYFKQDLEETKLFLESLLGSKVADQAFKESVESLSTDIAFLSKVCHQAVINRKLKLAADKFEEISQKLLFFVTKNQDYFDAEKLQSIQSSVDVFKFGSGWSKGWSFVIKEITGEDKLLEISKNYSIGFEIIADTVDKYFDSLDIEIKVGYKITYLDIFVSFTCDLSTLMHYEEILEGFEGKGKRLTKFKQARNASGFIAWKLINSAESAEDLEKSEEELEYSKFQARLSEYPDWNREEEINKNQGVIELIRSWLAEEISEEEKKEREEHFERFKKIVDSQRPPGQKLYCEE